MKSVLYLKTVEHPEHLAGEQGAKRELHDSDAYYLVSTGHVAIEGETEVERPTDQGSAAQAQ